MFIAVPALFGILFYIPGYLYISIKTDIEESDHVTSLSRYKYHYINGEFKNIYFYWEFIRLFEKIII